MRSRTDDTLRYVQFMARRFDKGDINAVTLAILIDLGFTTGNEGFLYLRRAIEMRVVTADAIVSKGFYPAISRIYETGESWQSVDQAIRREIRLAWDDRDVQVWEVFFPPRRRRSSCPSNKEFIARISCIIELWQSCKEAGYERII